MSSIWVVDFGSQYTQLITRKLRELGYQSEIFTVEDSLREIKKRQPRALVLSGGPQSIFEDQTDYQGFFENPNLPILGVCYGMQLLGAFFHGKVERGVKGEYGLAKIKKCQSSFLPNLPDDFNVWMSHFDHVSVLPENFELIFKSENNITAGIKHSTRPILGFQFHPEVQHSEFGTELLSYFLKEMSKLEPDWKAQDILKTCQSEVQKVKGEKVLCAFSGGVDSLVAAMLTHQVIGEDLYCFFVDHGLLRPQDLIHLETLKKSLPLKIEIIKAEELFLLPLRGVSDPEEKRKIIGKTFIDVFEKKVKEFEENHQIKFSYLLQGTLYPDVIESISPHIKGGKSVTIKSHHNVGGLPERMNLKLLEPLRFLFKDEVRRMGVNLGLDPSWVMRHPFPGPGIGVRVLGELKPESIKKVQHSDQILFEELKQNNLYEATWQAFTVLLPVKTVGVKGDGRVFEEVIALRLVNSQDGMTASVTELPWKVLHKISARICNEVKGVTRVVFDLTSKPPGTIEWE